MITNARYKLNQGYPELHFDWDGEPAIATLDQNQSLIEEGYISIHPQDVWEQRLPPLTLPANPAIGRGETELISFTRDPEVVGLAQVFARAVRDGKFREGPVDQP